MTRHGGIEEARGWLAELSDSDLANVSYWELGHYFRVEYRQRHRVLNEERLRRGIITIADLPPHERRELIDPANLDLHALAAGPIMDSNEIYLPAGKISLEEAKAREAAGVERLA